jgi:transposase
MLDSTACKAQRFASGARGGGEEAPGRSRGGPTTKIHAVVDGLRRPLCFPLTPGQAADCRQARSLLEGLAFERLIGDHGGARPPASEAGPGGHRRGPRPGRGARRRSGDPVEAQPESADPTRSQVHKARRKVENLSCRTKDFTRVTLRKCETSRSYAGFVSLAFARINIQLCQWTLGALVLYQGPWLLTVGRVAPCAARGR